MIFDFYFKQMPIRLISSDLYRLRRWVRLTNMLTNKIAKSLSLVFHKFTSQVLRGISTNWIFTQSLIELGHVSSNIVVTFLQACLGSFLVHYHLNHIQLICWYLVDLHWL